MSYVIRSFFIHFGSFLLWNGIKQEGKTGCLAACFLEEKKKYISEEHTLVSTTTLPAAINPPLIRRRKRRNWGSKLS